MIHEGFLSLINPVKNSSEMCGGHVVTPSVWGNLALVRRTRKLSYPGGERVMRLAASVR